MSGQGIRARFPANRTEGEPGREIEAKDKENEAISGKAPIAKAADRVSGVFVPVVMALSALTAVIWLLCGQEVGFALDAADVVLMNSRLTDVAAAVRLSRMTLRNIHENLFWAFIYNVIGIPLAAGAWIGLTGWEMNPCSVRR